MADHLSFELLLQVIFRAALRPNFAPRVTVKLVVARTASLACVLRSLSREVVRGAQVGRLSWTNQLHTFRAALADRWPVRVHAHVLRPIGGLAQGQSHGISLVQIGRGCPSQCTPVDELAVGALFLLL